MSILLPDIKNEKIGKDKPKDTEEATSEVFDRNNSNRIVGERLDNFPKLPGTQTCQNTVDFEEELSVDNTPRNFLKQNLSRIVTIFQVKKILKAFIIFIIFLTEKTQKSLDWKKKRKEHMKSSRIQVK